MKKEENKIKVSYNIKKVTYQQFEKFSKENAINMSALVDLLIIEYLKNHNDKNGK